MKKMTPEHSPIDPLTHQTFIPDLVPMYQLSEPEYQAVVMGSSNLMVAIVQELHTKGQGELASRIATQAHGVLVAFDEDVAEVVRVQARGCVHPV